MIKLLRLLQHPQHSERALLERIWLIYLPTCATHGITRIVSSIHSFNFWSSRFESELSVDCIAVVYSSSSSSEFNLCSVQCSSSFSLSPRAVEWILWQGSVQYSQWLCQVVHEYIRRRERPYCTVWNIVVGRIGFAPPTMWSWFYIVDRWIDWGGDLSRRRCRRPSKLNVWWIKST